MEYLLEESNLIDELDLNNPCQTTERNIQPFSPDTTTIEKIENSSHYICTKCFKFPFIKFCKDRKHIRLTCSCFNNYKILIRDFFKENSLSMENLYQTNNSETNTIISHKLLCQKHQQKYKGFSYLFSDNICLLCIDKKLGMDVVIKFDEIKIDDKILEQLIEKINNNNNINSFDSDYSDRNKIIVKNNDGYQVLGKKEEDEFNNLINIILDDYKNYPNYCHFYNIKNLLYFFGIEDRPICTKKEEKIFDNEIIENNEPIIIEYNNSNKVKLFSKIFIRNNKKKFKIEIEGKKIDLIDEYKFKSNEEKVRIKLFINKGVSEIDMYKMFANCIDLMYIDGISKLKKIKIININKMFYNCISLLFIPDFFDWEIRKCDTYLMFYNCISFAFFPYKRNIINYYFFIII